MVRQGISRSNDDAALPHLRVRLNLAKSNTAHSSPFTSPRSRSSRSHARRRDTSEVNALATPSRVATALSERYRVDRQLGAGGMATVYLAENLKRHRCSESLITQR